MPLPTNPGIDQWIAAIRFTPQTLVSNVTKKIVADAASSGAWTYSTLQQVSRTGVDGRNPVDIFNAIGIIEPYSPVLIGIIGISSPCGLKVIQEVSNKRQSTSPGLARQYQKLDAVLDGKFSEHQYLTSILSKVISDKLSGGSIR